MTDGQKLVLSAAFSLIVGTSTGAVGYFYRDSFDAPRLRIQLIQFQLSRFQCPIESASLYRFRTAHALRNHIEDAVPWSLVDDLRDDELEYAHTEDLLRLLPQRRKYLEKELPFVDQELNSLASYLAAPSTDGEALVKGVIAYVAGVKAGSEKDPSELQRLYVMFDTDPKAFTQQLQSDLKGRKKALEQEIELIPTLLKELDSCFRAGKPAALKMIGNNLDEMPNVQFDLNVLNTGRTDGQVSHAMTFTSKSSKTYRINLVGQNPRFNTTTSPTAWARIRANQMDRLNYTIDRVRNEAENVRQFYQDLTSDQGITGVFQIKDIEGKSHSFLVSGSQASN